jgi:hypothetical protein
MRKIVPAAGARLLARVSLGLLCFAAFGARAADDFDLYRAVVPLKSSAEADRTAACGEALRIVATRVSGQRGAAARSDVADAAANPARYVQQYSARSNRTLSVGFDPQAVEQLVLEAGLPIWPAERPPTLVLLFTPSVAGGERAVLAGEAAPERADLEKVADQRGLRLTWPRSSISASVAADPNALTSAGGEPGASRAGVLVGVAKGSEFEWRYVTPDGESAARRGSVAEGGHLAADTLASRYATPSTRNVARDSVLIGGITGLDAYAGVVAYLESLSMVRHVDVEEASGSSMRLGVTMRGDRELLRRVVALGDTLRPGAGDGGVEFTYAP